MSSKHMLAKARNVGVVAWVDSNGTAFRNPIRVPLTAHTTAAHETEGGK